MTRTMMGDRGMMMTGMGMSGSMPMMAQAGAMPGMMPGMGMGMMMVPRCTVQMERIDGGMKMTCRCEDEMAGATLQNMCRMLAGSMLSMCCTMSGMPMYMCNMGMCKCECTDVDKGVCFTCTSGDQAMAEMIQACCDCACACMKAGCMDYMCMGGMPVCCCTSC